MPMSSDGVDTRLKRRPACLQCRREKLKCDGTPDRTCTRCRDEGLECVVRPRANAAVLANDLRWWVGLFRHLPDDRRQQTVEIRLKGLSQEVADVRALSETLQGRLNGSPGVPSIATGVRLLDSPRRAQHLPRHLTELRDALTPAFEDVQRGDAVAVSLEEACLLWE